MSKDRMWLIGIAFGTIVFAFLAWFVGISPQLDRSSQLASDTDVVKAQNQIFSQKLNVLEKTNKVKLKAELEALHQILPSETNYPDILRFISGAAKAAGVTLGNVTNGEVIFPVTGQQEAAAAQSSKTPATDTPSGTPTDTASTAPVDAAQGAASDSNSNSNLVAIPVTISATGDANALRVFVQQLYAGPRLLTPGKISTAIDVNATSLATTFTYEGYVYVHKKAA